jgi:hypothetical protein
MNYRYSFFLLMAMLPLSLCAQSGFTLDTNHLSLVLVNVDSSELLNVHEMRSALGNTSTDTLNLRWTVHLGDDWPQDWKVHVADPTINYPPFVTTSPMPTVLYPGDTAIYFASYVWPEGTTGCGEYAIVLENYEQDSMVYDTIHYQFSINEANCSFLTALEPEAQPNFRVFPNPFTNQLNLETDFAYRELALYDALGQKVQSLPSNAWGKYRLSEIGPGVYLLALTNGEGKRYWRKVVKR